MYRRTKHPIRAVAAALAVAVAVAMMPAAAFAAPAAASVSPWSLQYQVYHVATAAQEPGELWLVVQNPTSRLVTITFPTSQRVDFVLWRDWKPVWRASAGQMFAQVVQKEVLGPYQARIYKATLPDTLVPGPYYVSAYLAAQGMSQYAVAWTEIQVEGTRVNPADLQYSLYVRDWGWQDPGRLGLSISNRQAEGVTLDYPEWWAVKVAIYDRQGQVVWEKAVPRPDSSEIMPAGSSRYYSFPLPWLASGTYAARAWFSPAGSAPVAETTFTR